MPTAAEYRCARRLDPIVVLERGTTRRYLGGRFSVPVRAVPDDATYLGGADGRSLYVERGRVGRLFAIEGGGVERWLELPTRLARPAPPVNVDPSAAGAPVTPSAPSVFVIGDSIALGSASEITSALASWTTTIDAVVGRPSGPGVAIAPTVAATSPTAVVVELGTNDRDAAAFATNARAMLRALTSVPLVVWVMPHAPSTVTIDVRREIVRLVGRTPNGILADWDAAVPDDALSSDGVHLLPDRVGLFADFLSRPLRAWRLATAGAGAAACIA